MKVLYGYKDITGKLKNPIVAIGVFDGIHIGHQRVIKKLFIPRKDFHDKVIITFDPHPETILRPKRTPPRIMSLEHRISLLQKMGLDATVIINFTHAFSEMTPEEFIKKVLSSMGAKTVYVGSNFYFGKGKQGDVKTFKTIGKNYDIDIVEVKPVKTKGRIVSSSWLRRLISSGNIKEAARLLRRDVSVLGTVVKGSGIGALIGIPTANIDPHQEVIPPPGVYAVKVKLGEKMHDGVLNVGFKPTFYGRLKRRKEPHIEVHIFDFKGSLYGQIIEVFFIKRLRRERKFKNVEALTRAIKKDINQSKAATKGGRF